MALIKSVRGFTPSIGEDCFLAENATLIGDVICGDLCSFWYTAVVRGDVSPIRLGNKVNIQDGAVIHGTFEKSETKIGNNVSIGHRAIVHGSTIEDNVLVGMGAILMDHVYVESNVLIASGAVVLEGTRLESGYLYAGIPAKKIKPLGAELLDGQINRIAEAYIKYSGWFKE